jgi:hypothetical protein
VALVRTDVSEERIAFIIRVTRTGEPGTMFVVSVTTNIVLIPVTLMMMRYAPPNAGSYKSHMASHPRRRHSSQSLLCKPQILHKIIGFKEIKNTTE